MIPLMLKEWRDATPFACLYLFACLVAGRLLAPLVPALDTARGAVAALLALGFVALAAARPFAGERALGTLEFTASLPVGRGRLFLAKTLSALLASLLGIAAIAGCFDIAPADISLSRPVILLPDAFASDPLIHAASALLLFAAVLFAAVAGLGEFAALGLGGLVWGAFASVSTGLRVSGLYNPILANLLPALGLLAAAMHLFARGEPFDGSRRAADLARAALVLPATVAALHLLALVASPPANGRDLAARTLHGRPDEAGVRTGPFAALERDGACALRTRVPWWDPFAGARGYARRLGWVDLPSGEVRLVPSPAAFHVTPAPDRKRCAWIEAPEAGRVGAGRLALLEGPYAPARSVDFSATPGFRADRVVWLEWRPDGTRLLATDDRSRIALVDPAAARATACFQETGSGLRRHFWGDAPDALALADYRILPDHGAPSLHRFRVPRDGALADPFAELGNAGGTVEALTVAGPWLLAVERGPDGRRLHARRIDGGEIRVHPLPDEFTRPLDTGWAPPLLRYDPAGTLEGIAGRVEGATRARRARGLLRWRLDLASGRESVTILESEGELDIVEDTSGRARLIGVAPEGDGARESGPGRWYRFDPETFALAPANFVEEEHRTSLTWWPGWIRNGVLSGNVAMFLEDSAGILRSFPLPAPGVTAGVEGKKILLPCPRCGR